MRFIHGKKRNRALAKRFKERTTAKSFRRNIDQFEFTSRQRLNTFALFSSSECAINQRRGNAATMERIDLIFHQRDERRNDNCRPFQKEGVELITERFATACWHHHKTVGTACDGCDYFFLSIEKLTETKIFFEGFMGGHTGSSLSNSI